MATKKERRQNRLESSVIGFPETTRKQIAQMRKTEAQEGCISRHNKGIFFLSRVSYAIIIKKKNGKWAREITTISP